MARNEKTIELANRITQEVLDSELTFGEAIGALEFVLHEFREAQDNFARSAEVCKASEYAPSGLFRPLF